MQPERTSVIVHLYVVRHATHADFGRRLTGRAPGGPLTPEGQREATALAKSLRDERLDEIHTSPRERALGTAAVLGAATGLVPVPSEALDEIDFGAWTGASFASLEGDPLWSQWNSARASARPPGGESMNEAAGRIAGHAARLATERAGARVALVTHCDMIRALVAHCLGLSLDNLLRFEVEPASLSRIEVAPWGARVISLNENKRSEGCRMNGQEGRND